MKTKAQEIEILQRTIAALGPDTYLGPWLDSIIEELRADLRNDFYPVKTLRDHQLQCQQLKTGAEDFCRQQKDRARIEAQRILETAQTSAAAIRARLTVQLRSSLQQLE